MMKFKNKNRVVIVLVVLLLVVGSIFAYLKYSTEKNAPTNTPSTEKVNLNPPSTEEKKAGNLQKETIVQEKDHSSNIDNEGKEAVSVIITDAGEYDNVIEVRAFVPEYYQDGTCTITFTQNSLKVTKETPAYKDVSSTICTNPLFPKSEFSNSGNWQVVVTYKSSSAEGVSQPRTINIK